jgi:plastocyanin
VAGIAEQWSSPTTSTFGTTFGHTFTHVGTFAYYCSIHGSDNGNQTASGISGTITVVPVASLTSITVTPANTTIAPGNTEQYMATGHVSDNTDADITNQVTWDSSNTAVATISNAAGSQGLATGVTPGTSTITAKEGTLASGPVTLTVTPAAPVMIMVSPTNPSVIPGQTEQFMAMGMYSDNSTQDLTT